ncbi:MAG: PIG-L family deacetylase [Sediminibacterium sp.]|nr:PIG-L family deacetylase [Sediminibacterium sp.]MBP6144744.1 PIG-L family deacetylase [Sediminibacterium sp.]
MKQFSLVLLSIVCSAQIGFGQKNSAEIYTQLKQMEVLGSVLYIAAHPDDENNAFLPYLTKERHYRTAYLSLTRGDGGQNLIGKEQGVELGLIRTQELLAARMQDGAEQYFSTAYEFGFSKSAKEALAIWDHQKVLSDVVWVIRKFQPDVIITRFPGDARAGHGHHAASSIIAQEAYIAAADPKQFPEQFKYGVQPWKAKRILWNTFNFGTINTTNDNQLKLEVGGYNPVIGKSYGEIGAEARTMHKSQGEGRPRRRGSYFEFFQHLNGDSAKLDLMDGVTTNWSRLNAASIQEQLKIIIGKYTFDQPSAIVADLVAIYQQVNALPKSNWKEYQLNLIQSTIESAAGLLAEASTTKPQVLPGSSISIQVLVNQRTNINTTLSRIELLSNQVSVMDTVVGANLIANQNQQYAIHYNVPLSQPITQPYWLVAPKTEGMFVVQDQNMIGKAENNPPFSIQLNYSIAGQLFEKIVPVHYKYLDPTKGDVYQPIVVLPKKEVAPIKSVVLMPTTGNKSVPSFEEGMFHKTIQYDHIPAQTYFQNASMQVVKVDIKKQGQKVGYIDGAGDAIPEALEQLGYEVVYLKEADITAAHLKGLDAIVVGIRAFNMYAYLTEKQSILNDYIAAGGNLIVQYIKSNQVGTQNIKMGPYPFTINSGKRVTEENALVTFALPNHPVLNVPNKINSEDFSNWVQERSTYQAENIDPHFQTPLQMNDTGETPSQGSLLIVPFGKGNFAYVSLALFRQLPAGNPGAYKLFANLISLPKN